MSLQPTVAAYIAAMIDGEGTIALIHQIWRTKRGRIYTHRPYVSIANKDRAMLDSIARDIGAGNVRAKGDGVYTYEIWHSGGVNLLRQLRPWLRSKGDQADLVFEFARVRAAEERYAYADQTVLSAYCTRMRELHYKFSPGAKRLIPCSAPYTPPVPKNRSVVTVLAIPKDSILYR
jgi:hypothetical protein